MAGDTGIPTAVDSQGDHVQVCGTVPNGGQGILTLLGESASRPELQVGSGQPEFRGPLLSDGIAMHSAKAGGTSWPGVMLLVMGHSSALLPWAGSLHP